MTTMIRLKVEKLIEDNQEYFIATSDDLEGLVAEGKTIKEVIEIAEDVAKILIITIQDNSYRVRDLPIES